MNHKITITTVETLVINKALRQDLGNDIDNEMAQNIIKKINDIVKNDLYNAAPEGIIHEKV